jgi:aerobic-type carbon monoxide dehydrogenase small subunit (CoxS/CutS family)
VRAFKLHINGESRVVVAANDMPLLWVLRDFLGLMGTKYGCGIGQCGACTVHIDDDAVPSCTLSLSAVRGRQVTTIEGLVADGQHPLIEAWIAEQVPQCGYCQPGQIMAAAALLMKNPRPTDTDIDDTMAGNLCRCGTYLRIRRAIHRVARS